MNMNIDQEFMDNKLKDYSLVSAKDVSKGMHLRYTKNKYKEEGRNCCYGVVQKMNEDGTFMVNSYKDKIYPDWKINPLDKWKRFKLYKKNEREWTGQCDDCEGAVEEPWFLCYDCLLKRKEEN